MAVGQKRPLSIPEIQQITAKIRNKENARDLALFCVAIDSMLRGIDIINLKVHSVTDGRRQVLEKISVMQRKTNRPVIVQLELFTQVVLQQWINESEKVADDFIFTGRTDRYISKPITSSHYRTLVKKWVSMAGLDPKHYSTHSLRRSKAVLVYEATKDPEVVRVLLGHSSISSTVAYLGISVNRALKAASQVKIFHKEGPKEAHSKG